MISRDREGRKRKRIELLSRPKKSDTSSHSLSRHILSSPFSCLCYFSWNGFTSHDGEAFSRSQHYAMIRRARRHWWRLEEDNQTSKWCRTKPKSSPKLTTFEKNRLQLKKRLARRIYISTHLLYSIPLHNQNNRFSFSFYKHLLFWIEINRSVLQMALQKMDLFLDFSKKYDEGWRTAGLSPPLLATLPLDLRVSVL